MISTLGSNIAGLWRSATIVALLAESFVAAAPTDYNTTTVQISAPSSAPDDASKVVDPDFQAWASAVHWWPDFAGNDTSPNIFSQTLVKIITEKQGSTPVFRVGGTSGDRTYFHPEQEESIIIVQSGPSAIPLNVSIGPVFFEGFRQFPDARFTFQVNLARNDSGALAGAVAEAREAVNYIQGNLESLEIGNEVDVYRNTVRPSNWTVDDYVSEWLNYSRTITYEVLEGNEYGLDPDLIYQAPCYAKPLPRNPGFDLVNTFEHGIDTDNNIKSSAIHQYMNGAGLDRRTMTRQNIIMNHTAIVNNITNFRPAQDYLAANHPDIPLYLAETASLAATLNADDFTAVFGAALWGCDDLLYAMSQNIDRIYLQQGTVFDFASWRPVIVNGVDPAVKAPYYGNLFIADAMGDTTSLRVKNIDLNSDVFSAYALYDGDALAKYAVVNLLEWNSTTSYERPETSVELDVPDTYGGVKLKYLKAAGADADQGITWGGQSWNYSSTAEGNVEVTGEETLADADVSNGKAVFTLRASEAVLVTW